MKRSKILTGVLGVALLTLVACETASDPVGPNDQTLAKKAVYPADAGNSSTGVYTLWADLNQVAGAVTFSESGLNIVTNDDYDIRGVHLYTWMDEEDIPTDRPDPGHADFSQENVHASSLIIDLDSDSYNFITVHVALEQGHRAYAGGDVYPDGFPDERVQWWGYIRGYSFEAPK